MSGLIIFLAAVCVCVGGGANRASEVLQEGVRLECPALLHLSVT